MKKHQIKPVIASPDFPQLERERVVIWEKNKILDRYLHKNDLSTKKFFFLDGPITANAPMGIHHAWGRTYKDLWQRYFNMKGFKQRFQNGFDCQGLWVEVEVEKEKGFKTKKDIESFGLAKFVSACKDRVKKFSEIQTNQSKRLGYFMDWDNSYFTMSDENNYMIWHFLKVCHQKRFIYQGHDSVPWCPRCETAISQHEMLTSDYKEVTHNSIYLQLPIQDRQSEFLIIWTTTPWTIPGNVAVAVDVKLSYSLLQLKTGEKYWIATDLVSSVFSSIQYKILKTEKGKVLVGLKYASAFDDLDAIKQVSKKSDAFHSVIATDTRILPISTTEGTGLVHIATGSGSEDYRLGEKYSLPTINLIKDNADYQSNLGTLSNKNAKKDPDLIFEYLKSKENSQKWIFKITPYKHRYPACWRCKHELVWKLADEWYIAMDRPDPDDKKGRTLRQKMIDVAKTINWIPEFGLDRELDWLNNMHDWLISKNRYWGLALPIWVCDKCSQFDVIGGKQELKQKQVSGYDQFKAHSPHKPYIDKVKLRCSCGGSMTRIPDVGNPWLDAGIVPFSTLIDPDTGKPSYTDDKKYFKRWFPADFITESFPGQFKNWFYSLIAMSTVLEDIKPFSNILGFASMLAEDGREMHKSWGNSLEFNEVADKIGADIARWAFVRHNQERNLLFGFKMTEEVRRKFHLILWNSYRYFANYATLEKWQAPAKIHSSQNILDRWILARLNNTISIVSKSLDKFQAPYASIAIESLVNDLSTWYIRRSRSRVGIASPNKLDKTDCYNTLFQVLETISRLTAPFTPFMSDNIYTNLTGEDSVHLSNWPKTTPLSELEKELIADMELVRRVCEQGNAERKRENIPTRQPLSDITVTGASNLKAKNGLLQLIKDELNIDEVILANGNELNVKLNTELTDDLISRGEVRLIIRKVQEERKKNDCTLSQKIKLTLPDWPEKYEQEIKTRTLTQILEKGPVLKIEKLKK